MVPGSCRGRIIATLRVSSILLFMFVAMGLRPARSDDVTIQSFFGTYEGRTLMPMGEARNRNLRVVIRPFGAFGFTIEWLTTLHTSGKAPEGKMQAIDFEPTRRPNIYAAARGDGAAGGGGEGPAEGEPYAWARLAGGSLTVNLLTITDNGDYVIQTYDRSLTPDGMKLTFLRFRNGRIERRIKAALKKGWRMNPAPRY